MKYKNKIGNNENAGESSCFSGSSWIWSIKDKMHINQYVEFRHEFTLESVPSEDSRMYISVDTDYALWLNGNFVSCGQYHDFPEDKVYDCLPVGNLLNKGWNVICILSYYQGENSSQYIKGEPRLIYYLDYGVTRITSGRNTRYRDSNSYTNGSVARISPQLSFTFEYNACSEDNWISVGYTMGKEWKCCIEKDSYSFPTRERPVTKLKIKERCDSYILSQGVFFRKHEKMESVAQLMQSDYLSFRCPNVIFELPYLNSLPSHEGIRIKPLCLMEGTGTYLVIDLGREECGFFEIELEGEKGVVIDISYGEHLDDLRVRASVGGRNFAARYICRGGRQVFTHYFKRFAGRYIQLHIRGMKTAFTLYYAGLRPSVYPVSELGFFKCPDSLHNKIYDVAARTLRLCMHEHYEDCPLREQALYAMDSRNQAICGYYCFGEYDFPQASFELLGKGIRSDGYLEICAPSKLDMTIPSFSMIWIIELYEHLLFSGRVEPVAAALPAIKKMINGFFENMRNGLIITPMGEEYWHFYEWNDGINGLAQSSDGIEVLVELRFDAPLNLLFSMALESAAQVAKICGDIQTCEHYNSVLKRLKVTVHKVFWDKSNKLYRTYEGKNLCGGFNELTQALALCAGICPDHNAVHLRKKLSEKNNHLKKITLSHSIYKYKALLAESDKYSRMVFENIADIWGHMLFKGATSFWETFGGADDFDKAGSLCHGWSAVPIYFYYAYGLGVRPVKPGFKAFKVYPAYNAFDRACGQVPTPYGNISVRWQKTSRGPKCEVDYPDGTILL